MRRYKHQIWILIAALLLGCTAAPTETAPVPTDPPAAQVVISITEVTSQSTDTRTSVPQPTDTPAPSDTPQPTDTPTEEPVPTETPAPYVPKEGVYTIAWISDPQHYSAKFPELYTSMTEFLRDNRDALNLAYVINTGDLVNDTTSEKQWEVASLAQSYIDEIPNGVLAGNHDCQKGDFKPYQTYFGEKRYKNRSWYGESYKDNRGHYDLLTIGKTDYLFVYMSFGPDSAGIRWLNKVFAAYPDRVGFLLLHDYYTKAVERSEDGKKLYEKVVLQNPNLYFVLCGHKYGAHTRIEGIDDTGDGLSDRTLVQMMFNYQAAGKVGGDGYLRLMQVDETNHTMHMLTYSPSQNDFNRFDDPAMREPYYDFDESFEDFVLPLPWPKADTAQPDAA